MMNYQLWVNVIISLILGSATLNVTALAAWDNPEFQRAKIELNRLKMEEKANPGRYSIKQIKDRRNRYMNTIQKTFYLTKSSDSSYRGKSSSKYKKGYRPPQVVRKSKNKFKVVEKLDRDLVNSSRSFQSIVRDTKKRHAKKSSSLPSKQLSFKRVASAY